MAATPQIFDSLIEIFRLLIHEGKILASSPAKNVTLPHACYERRTKHWSETFIRKTGIFLKMDGFCMVAVFFPLWIEATRNCNLIIRFIFLFRSRGPLRRRSGSRECKTFSRNGNKCKKIYEEILMCK